MKPSTILFALFIIMTGCAKKSSDNNTNPPAATTDPRAKFVKAWTAHLDCNNGQAYNFGMQIALDLTDSSRLKITDLTPGSGPLIAIIDPYDPNKVSIPIQALHATGDSSISGRIDYGSDKTLFTTASRTINSAGMTYTCNGSAF